MFRSDGGGEYEAEFLTHLQTLGIEIQLTHPDSSQSNGVAERYNLTLLDSVRTFFADTHLPRKLWSHLVETAEYLYNRRPHSATHKTPHKLVYGTKPDVSKLSIHYQVFNTGLLSDVGSSQRPGSVSLLSSDYPDSLPQIHIP